MKKVVWLSKLTMTKTWIFCWHNCWQYNRYIIIVKTSISDHPESRFFYRMLYLISLSKSLNSYMMCQKQAQTALLFITHITKNNLRWPSPHTSFFFFDYHPSFYLVSHPIALSNSPFITNTRRQTCLQSNSDIFLHHQLSLFLIWLEQSHSTSLFSI